MAHRKPVGTTFTSTFDWRGRYPELDDYLVSQAGTWYRVVGVQEQENPAKIGLTLERTIKPWPADELRIEGRVHDFEWYERKRTRA